jgi:hypothetical protein
MCPNGHVAAGCKKHCMEHKLLEFFNPVVSHGFKSIVACVLVGEVGLNFYTLLDEASKLKVDASIWSMSRFWINARRNTTSVSPFTMKCETRY